MDGRSGRTVPHGGERAAGFKSGGWSPHALSSSLMVYSAGEMWTLSALLSPQGVVRIKLL